MELPVFVVFPNGVHYPLVAELEVAKKLSPYLRANVGPVLIPVQLVEGFNDGEGYDHLHLQSLHGLTAGVEVFNCLGHLVPPVVPDPKQQQPQWPSQLPNRSLAKG